MPNWCYNSISFMTDSKDVAEKIITACKVSNLLETFRPLPNGEWDYDWCVTNWGTKWEAQRCDVSNYEVVDGHHFFVINNETAWSPPLAALDAGREALGFDYEIEYMDESLMFVGRCENGENESYEPIDDDGTLRPDLPEWAEAMCGSFDGMSSETHDEAYDKNKEITLEDVHQLIPDSHRKMIQSLVIDALRDAGYEPHGLSWNIIVEFFDDKLA